MTKKYRIANYDGYDKLYASGVKNSFLYNKRETQAKFNEFTDMLMEDTQISRFKLLDAIDDYDRSEYVKRWTGLKTTRGIFVHINDVKNE